MNFQNAIGFSDLPTDMHNPNVRRRDLKAIAEKNKLKVTPEMRKADLIDLLKARQISVDVKIPDGKSEELELSGMKIFQLRALAKEMGVEFSNTTKATELREKITEALNG